MTSSWIGNFAGFNHTYTPTGMDTNIDDFFNKKEEDTNVIKMIELKESLINILQNKEEIDFTDDIVVDSFSEGEEEEEENETENENENENENETKNETEKGKIDVMIKKINSFIQEFIVLQTALNKINNDFQSEVTSLQKNITTIESMISFLKKLPDDYKDETILKDIIDSMHQLSQKIIKNEQIQKLKIDYVQKRREMEKYIYFMKKLNNFNHCNICPLCFTNTVDHFLDPCGHTFCKSCIQLHLRKNGELDLYQVGRDDNSQCCYCRERIKTVRQLYFL